jgi:uroporphyrinogen-III synthase
MRVIVTRPLEQAAEWVAALRSQRIDAVALPLIAIAGAPDPRAVEAEWSSLHDRQLVVFVSPNAASAFFASAPAGRRWPPLTRAASPGPGTTRKLIELGVPPALVDAPADSAAQFDSEALWERLRQRTWHGASVLVVRGTRGRAWLAGRLVEAGAQVDELAAYRRETPMLDPAARADLRRALARPAGHLWLFSSSEAIDRLLEQSAPGVADAATWGAARALATHPRIAQRARDAGFGVVLEARPTPAAVVACIQSIRP